ncbi:MAG TPA: VTT domain-containing protein [Sandaracinaceae bacterium LLY-WYZ-13_1]|nr:VTT domain-containing protein [Sandaracinaceae bacterium LLY-WYZ-13_1]
MLKRATFLCRPAFWLVCAFLAAAVALHRWVEGLGGPDALVERFGLGGPFVLTGVLGVTSAGPFPTELFALASAAAYGWAIGALVTWAGWTVGSMIQYGLARRGRIDVSLDAPMARVPAWLRRFPIDHPIFLVVVRWLPMGFHLANVAAGVRRVPVARQLAIAAVGSIPGAVLWAGIGAGVRWLG